MIRQGMFPAAHCLLALSLCGCMPSPHRTQAIPALSGTVLHDGAPVQGAVVGAAYGLDRKKSLLIGTTDKNGAFSYEGKKEFHFFTFIGDPGFDWVLTIRTSDKTYRGYADHGLGYVPEKIAFTCELSRPDGQSVCGTTP